MKGPLLLQQRGKILQRPMATAISRGGIDWPATLRDAATHMSPHSGAQKKSGTAKIRLTRLLRRPYRQTPAALMVVLLDTSGSMLHKKAFAAAKGILTYLLTQAYVQRKQLLLLGFDQGHVARIWGPGKTPPRITHYLATLSAAGGTPLRQGIDYALQYLRQEQQRRTGLSQEFVIISDGRTHESVSGLVPHCPTYFIDTESTDVRLKHGEKIARQLAAIYVHVESLPLLNGIFAHA